MVRPLFPRSLRCGLVLAATALIAGCGMVPRAHVDDCQRLSQTLRSDNARLKDQVLALQDQNRDYAERAVDDARRIAVQDQTIERLEVSVQAYQTERTKLESAYQQLTSNLDGLKLGSDDWPTQARAGRRADADSPERVSTRRSKPASTPDDQAAKR